MDIWFSFTAWHPLYCGFQLSSISQQRSHLCGSIDRGGYSTGMGQEDIQCVYMSMTRLCVAVGSLHFILIRVTSNWRSEFGGISGGAPLLPYAAMAGMVTVLFSPTCIPAQKHSVTLTFTHSQTHKRKNFPYPQCQGEKEVKWGGEKEDVKKEAKEEW